MSDYQNDEMSDVTPIYGTDSLNKGMREVMLPFTAVDLSIDLNDPNHMSARTDTGEVWETLNWLSKYPRWNRVVSS